MSQQAYVEIRGVGFAAGEDDHEGGYENNTFPYLVEVLGVLASKAGVTPPNDFCFVPSEEDHDAVEAALEAFEGDDEEREEERLMSERGPFHDPEDGLRTLDTLIHMLQAAPAARIRAGRHTFLGRDIAEELGPLRALIHGAAQAGQRFRIHLSV